MAKQPSTGGLSVIEALFLIERATSLDEVKEITAQVSSAPATQNIILYTGMSEEAKAAAKEITGFSLIDDTSRAELLQSKAFLGKIGQLAGMTEKNSFVRAQKILDRKLPDDDPDKQAAQLAAELLFGVTGNAQSLQQSFWGQASKDFVSASDGQVLLLMGKKAKRVFWGVELPALLERPHGRVINGIELETLCSDPDGAFDIVAESGKELATVCQAIATSPTGGGTSDKDKDSAPSTKNLPWNDASTQTDKPISPGSGPFAARITDVHTCPMVTVLVPHVGGPISQGCPTVLIGGLPAARVGDIAVCVGPPDVIAKGSPTVLIGGQPAARIGDLTAHGGTIVTGFPTVLIGE